MQEASARSAELEAATRRMAAELADFKAESKQLRNQELTIRRLEERARSLEAQLEAKVRRSETACGLLLSLEVCMPRRCATAT